jgi:hypothetical protein
MMMDCSLSPLMNEAFTPGWAHPQQVGYNILKNFTTHHVLG